MFIRLNSLYFYNGPFLIEILQWNDGHVDPCKLPSTIRKQRRKSKVNRGKKKNKNKKVEVQSFQNIWFTKKCIKSVLKECESSAKQ